MRLPERIEM